MPRTPLAHRPVLETDFGKRQPVYWTHLTRLQPGRHDFPSPGRRDGAGTPRAKGRRRRESRGSDATDRSQHPSRADLALVGFPGIRCRTARRTSIRPVASRGADRSDVLPRLAWAAVTQRDLTRMFRNCTSEPGWWFCSPLWPAGRLSGSTLYWVTGSPLRTTEIVSPLASISNVFHSPTGREASLLTGASA